MAAWFTVVAPFLPDIIQMAKPMFTRDKGAEQVPQQIKELQDAATQNAGAVKQLAGEMQRTLASLQQGASQLDNTLVRSEEHTSELQSLMRISYAVFCLKKTHKPSNRPHDADASNIH